MEPVATAVQAIVQVVGPTELLEEHLPLLGILPSHYLAAQKGLEDPRLGKIKMARQEGMGLVTKLTPELSRTLIMYWGLVELPVQLQAKLVMGKVESQRFREVELVAKALAAAVVDREDLELVQAAAVDWGGMIRAVLL